MTGRSPYRWVVLVVGILAYATSHFARQNYTGIQKFIQADFALDKGALGLLGAAFFYAYALFQMPWGIASDRFGSRVVTAFGILLTAATMAGFATSQSEQALLVWRAAAGIAGAAAYVSVAGGVARWFPPEERGFSQATFGGMGGALGEGAAFFLLPVLSIYFASGWRQATNAMAVVIVAMAVVCLAFLRSSPPGQPATTKTPFAWQLLADPWLWCYTALFAGFMVGIRTSQAWISVYLADVYATAHGFETNAAVVAGGIFATMAFSLVGRGIGLPAAGRLSDVLVARGMSRTAVVIGWLLLVIVLFQVLSMRVTALWLLAIVAVLAGTAVNCFTLITATVAETYGPQKTASITGFINMVGQLVGATSLAASGYLGVFMSGGSTDALAEYQGVWLSGVVTVTATAGIGIGLYVALRNRAAVPSGALTTLP
ncbi:MAG: MFS transporter [Acidobacteria bacterium]|nr:MFS transporter [Acidobacteriota bacterium]